MNDFTYKLTQKWRSSSKNELYKKFCSDGLNILALLDQASVADASCVLNSYYENSLFHWGSENVLQMSSPAWQEPLVKVFYIYDPPVFLT